MISKKSKILFPKKSLLIILLLSPHSGVFSQPNAGSSNVSSSIVEVKFEQLPFELGISNSQVNFIVQDKDGFMWFPATPGLIRYDGDNFNTYGTSRDGLEDSSDIVTCNGIPCGFNDRDGTLWFGTTTGVLLKYNRDYDKFSGMDLDEAENVPYSGIIGVIREDINGDLLIGTGGGLRIFNKKTRKLSYYRNANIDIFPNAVQSLYIDKNGLVFIGTTDKGLFIFDRSNYKILNYTQSSDYPGLKSNSVRCIYEDQEGNIWIGTDKGLNIFDRQRNEFMSFINPMGNPSNLSNDIITDICEDKNNGLWIVTYGGGLNRYDKDGIFTNYRYDKNNSSSLNTDFLYTLCVDNSNVLWIGTSNRGVCKFDLETKKFHTISRFFQNSGFSRTNDVSSIYMDSSGLFWIATTLNKGIFNFIKGKNGDLIFKGYSIISDAFGNQLINGCFEDKRHNIWFCSYNGILFMSDSNNKVFRIYESKKGFLFHRVIQLDDDQILLTTSAGVLKFDMNKKEFSDLNVHSDSLQIFPKKLNLWAGYVDRNKNLWFTWEGLIKYEIENNRFTKYTNIKNDTNSLQGMWPRVWGEDKSGNLLIVTSLGLNIYYKSTNRFKLYPVDINGNILEDESGNLWAGSNYEYGLSKFNPKTNEYRHFDVTDGLQGNLFNFHGAHFKDKDGTFYFGGPNGLTYFNPSEIKDNPYIPNIVLTDFQILNETVIPSPENPFLKKSVIVAKDVTLTYKENVFSFEFAALIYNNPSKNQYAYIMEGFDKDWVYCGTRRNVTYTNLDPGEYTFRVKGSNNDGIWNEEGTSINITITPPWWQTWWFKSCGAALVILTAGFGYKKRVNKLKKEKLAQEEYSRKLLSSQEDERKRIANELHDSIAHDILILKNDVENAKNESTEEKTISALNKISDHSSETLNDVRNISYNLHPHQIEALGLSKAIKSMIDKVSGSAKVNFISDIDNIDRIFNEANELHIYRIIQEAISNIVKHSNSSEAIIKVTSNKESISILISDNGKGFDADSVEKGSLGLSGISERVKMLGGTFNIESKRGEGTLLKIFIPIKI